MSFPFLFCAAFFSLFTLALVHRLAAASQKQHSNKASLSSFLQRYRLALQQPHQSSPPADSLLHTVSCILLHFLFPLWGFGFFLHSDANFLVVVLSIIISLQIHQRVYSAAYSQE